MIRINLLPFRAARKKENIRRQVSIYVLSLIFAFAVMGLVFVNLSGTLADVTAVKGEKQRELATYTAITQRIKEIEQQTKELETKLGVIRDLEASKRGPVRLLEEIADAVPRDKLWLASLEEKGGVLNLKGTAMDNDTVALFMTNLQKAEHIDTVDLNSTKLTAVSKEKINVTDFVLTSRTKLQQEKPKGQAGAGTGERAPRRR